MIRPGSTSLAHRVLAASLAGFLLVSGVACMTVLCGTACGGNQASASSTPLPPCHGGPAGPSTSDAPQRGACPEGGMVCCSTWLAEPSSAITILVPAPCVAPVPDATETPAIHPPTASAFERLVPPDHLGAVGTAQLRGSIAERAPPSSPAPTPLAG